MGLAEKIRYFSVMQCYETRVSGTRNLWMSQKLYINIKYIKSSVLYNKAPYLSDVINCIDTHETL